MATDDGDDMAILLQEAVSELQASRKQVETLMQENQRLIDQNSVLADEMEMIACNNTKGKQAKSKVEVSVHTKV